MNRAKARVAYLVGEKWFWLAVTPIFAFLPSRPLQILIACMSAYALYIGADARLEAHRAREDREG